MTCCEEFHKAFDPLANGDVHLGELPPPLHVKGQVAWYVYRGPYARLPEGWDLFWRKFATKNEKMEGAPGDVYICSPSCHKEDRGEKMLTILWAPLG